jgi:hypothetical protein
MNKASAALASFAIFGLAAAAHAGALQLSDWQMQAVTAGSAAAIAALQTSAAGRNATLQTSVGNIAAEKPHGSFAQSRIGVIATAAGNASVATDTFNQSAADGHGRPQIATASIGGSAAGGVATVRSVAITTAVSIQLASRHSSIGASGSLANITTFSVSGR